jgi:hypothetical protein
MNSGPNHSFAVDGFRSRYEFRRCVLLVNTLALVLVTLGSWLVAKFLSKTLWFED